MIYVSLSYLDYEGPWIDGIFANLEDAKKRVRVDEYWSSVIRMYEFSGGEYILKDQIKFERK